MSDKHSRKAPLIVEDTDHFAFFQPHDGRRRHGDSASHPQGLTAQTTFAKEITDAEQRHDGFFSLSRKDRDLDFSFLYVINRIRRITL